MKIVYLTTWDFVYTPLIADKPRLIDIQSDQPDLVTGNLAVYVEFGFPPKAADGTQGKAEYSGRFTLRKIKQTLKGFPGVKPKRAVLLLDPVNISDYADVMEEIEKQVKQIKEDYEKKDVEFPPFPS